MDQVVGEGIYSGAVNLLGSDTASWDANDVALIKSDFTPTYQLQAVDYVLADFTGSDPLDMDATTANVSRDAATGDWQLTIPPPSGGWHWEPTNTANLPQTIYGWVLRGDDGTPKASARFDTPVQLTAAAQAVDIPLVRITLPIGGLQ